jgi:hypothetical protein
MEGMEKAGMAVLTAVAASREGARTGHEMPPRVAGQSVKRFGKNRRGRAARACGHGAGRAAVRWVGTCRAPVSKRK